MRSFIDVDPKSHFPIQNLPYGIFRRKNSKETPRVGVAIGDYILDLSVLEKHGLFNNIISEKMFNQASLNKFMSEGKEVWGEVRKILQKLLDDQEATLRDDERLRKEAFLLQNDAEMQLPVEINEFTDFYASKEHASNVGTMFRGKDNALMPNWTHLPVAYHARASSVVVSGTDIARPQGQIKPPNSGEPIFSPSKQLDFELEVGYFVGTGNKHGSPISLTDAENNVFGLVLVNDWSARDIQAWEYQPLGPFLAKNFATTISPWVVTLEALEPFRTKGPKQDPEPLPYLKKENLNDVYDIHLEAHLKTEKMDEYQKIVSTNYKYLYWSMPQFVAHHTITGCNLETGDLFATGTISGPGKEEKGCFLELTWRGREPVKLPSNEERSWIMDGDELMITGWCDGGDHRIGFGKLSAKILPPNIIDNASLKRKETV